MDESESIRSTSIRTCDASKISLQSRHTGSQRSQRSSIAFYRKHYFQVSGASPLSWVRAANFFNKFNKMVMVAEIHKSNSTILLRTQSRRLSELPRCSKPRQVEPTSTVAQQLLCTIWTRLCCPCRSTSIHSWSHIVSSCAHWSIWQYSRPRSLSKLHQWWRHLMVNASQNSVLFIGRRLSPNSIKFK